MRSALVDMKQGCHQHVLMLTARTTLDHDISKYVRVTSKALANSNVKLLFVTNKEYASRFILFCCVLGGYLLAWNLVFVAHRSKPLLKTKRILIGFKGVVKSHTKINPVHHEFSFSFEKTHLKSFELCFVTAFKFFRFLLQFVKKKFPKHLFSITVMVFTIFINVFFFVPFLMDN